MEVLLWETLQLNKWTTWRLPLAMGAMEDMEDTGAMVMVAMVMGAMVVVMVAMAAITTMDTEDTTMDMEATTMVVMDMVIMEDITKILMI